MNKNEKTITIDELKNEYDLTVPAKEIAPKKTSALNVRVTKEQRKLVKQVAAYEDVSLQDMVMTCINLGLDKYYNLKKEGKTTEEIVDGEKFKAKDFQEYLK